MSKFIGIIFIFFSSFAQASTVYKSSLLSGRGGWGVAQEKEISTNFFLNPAALSDYENFYLNLEILADISEDSFEIIKNEPKVESGHYEENLNSYFGSYNIVQAGATPIIGYKGFFISPYHGQAKAEVSLNNKVFPEAYASFFLDHGVSLAKSFKIKENFYLGANLRYIQRELEEGKISVLSFDQGFVKEKSFGTGWSLSLGALYKTSYGNLGLSFLNLNEPTLIKEDVKGSWGKSLPREINLGLSSSFGLGSWGKYGIDFRDLESDVLLENRIYAGLELYPTSWTTLRAGLNQGYWSWGAGINLWQVLKIDFSSYGENEYLYYRKESRNYNLNFSLGWNL